MEYHNFSFDSPKAMSRPVKAKAPEVQTTKDTMDANANVTVRKPKGRKPKAVTFKEPEAPKEEPEVPKEEPKEEAKSSPVAVKAPEVQNKTSMALVSQIAQLVAQRDAEFLKAVATDYKLNYEELVAKYLVKAPEVKKKREVKVKVTKEGEEGPRCKGVTAKKEQCSFQPLKGGCFCKRHMPKEAEAPKEAVTPLPGAAGEETALSELMVIFTPETPTKSHDDDDATQYVGSPRSLLASFE